MVAVTDKAIEKLKVMISSGELRPGQRLPERTGPGRQPGVVQELVAEAVHALSLVRILDVRQGDGTYVSDLSAESLVDTLSFIVEFQHDSSVLELLEVRRILEPAACARAATEITSDALAELEKILELVTIHSPSSSWWLPMSNFTRPSHPPPATRCLPPSSTASPARRSATRVWRGITQEGSGARTLYEHRAIFEAIRAHDAQLASMWSTIHIAGVEDWLRRTLDTR